MAGQTRFRKLQVGKQSVLGTAVAATRQLPYSGIITLNPNRQIPDIDTGTLTNSVLPHNTGSTVTMSGASGPETFDDDAVRYSAGLKGGVTATGPTGVTAYTWTFQPSETTADAFDYYSVQTGDDTSDSAGAGTNGYGGVIDSLSETMPENLDAWTVSDDWVFAGAVYGNRTGALSLDASPIYVFGADTEVYLNTSAATIGTTKITDAVRGATYTVNNNLDQKRFANGSNTRFALAAYGRAAREITLTLTVEKTTAMIAEAVSYDDDPVPMRYIEVRTTSPSLAGTAIPYSRKIFLACNLTGVAEGEIGGNTNYTFTYTGIYDSTLTYATKVIVVNKLAILP